MTAAAERAALMERLEDYVAGNEAAASPKNHALAADLRAAITTIKRLTTAWHEADGLLDFYSYRNVPAYQRFRAADVCAQLARSDTDAATIAGLRAALERALCAMERVNIFVLSKERIKKPEGDEWWRSEMEAIDVALSGDFPPDPRDSKPTALEAAVLSANKEHAERRRIYKELASWTPDPRDAERRLSASERSVLDKALRASCRIVADPRDAEIERLRAELAEIETALTHDAECPEVSVKRPPYKSSSANRVWLCAVTIGQGEKNLEEANDTIARFTADLAAANARCEELDKENDELDRQGTYLYQLCQRTDLGAENLRLTADLAQARAELRGIVQATDEGPWLTHDRTGERVKRVCLTPDCITRCRALASAPPDAAAQGEGA